MVSLDVVGLIFYTAGELTRRELAKSEPYEPYALRFGIWTRGSFPRYLPILRDEWQSLSRDDARSPMLSTRSFAALP